MRWWNRKFKACSFAVKKSPPRRHKTSFQRRYDILRYRTTLKRRCVSTGLFVALYVFTNLCFALTFCLSITRKHCIKKRLCHRFFLWILQNFANFIIENLRTAVSETITENSLEWKTPYNQPRRSLNGF